MRHLTRLYVDLVIKNPAKKNRAVGSQGPGISDGIGMWFEQSYIRRFIKESDLSNDYLVAEGFKSRSQEEPYDVDLIIVDKVRFQIFLAQVKYHRRFRYYRWGDEIHDLFQYDDSGILKGYRQLKSVRQSITNTRVLDQIVNCLRKSGSKYPRNKIVPQNVHYVLLHTVTSLDFASINGICLYEWNTFRHLLRRGLSHKLVFRSGQITQVEAIQEDRVLPVEDPEATFQLTTKRFMDDQSGAKMVPHDDSAAYKMSVEVPQLIENGKFRARLKINIITPSF